MALLSRRDLSPAGAAGLLFLFGGGALAAPARLAPGSAASAPGKTVRVFIFAGQSNMEGADSNAKDIEGFPPFRGLDEAQDDVLFHYCIGRENKSASDGWTELAPVRDMVGPELSFARRVAGEVDDSLAIIKVAAGGTTLGEDWNPATPGGFKLYPLALERARDAIAALEKKGKDVELAGFMWHQGENDMFNGEFRDGYGANLKGFIARWRADLGAPELPFFIGGHCTKTVWGMDNRMNMYAIDRGQRSVTDVDPLVTHVPTQHIAVKIGGGEGLHYHYGSLGQLEHGEAYAEAYLRFVGIEAPEPSALKRWPYSEKEPITLFVLAGHRGMEGERAFTEDLKGVRGGKKLAKEDHSIALRTSLGGGFRRTDWGPLGPSGAYDRFGPEVSFGPAVKKALRGKGAAAIAKFTHSGSQLVDWTPEGSEAEARRLHGEFVEFVKESVASLEAKGHRVRIGAVLYHLSENDTAWYRARSAAAEELAKVIAGSREALGDPKLRWIVSQQAPAESEGLDRFDVVAAIAELAAADPFVEHLPALDLPGDNHPLALSAEGTVELGRRLAKAWADGR